LAKWGRRPIVEITRADVGALVTDIVRRRGPGAARKVRALLSKMYSFAMAHEWIDRNPVAGTLRPDIEPRDRYLRDEEVGAFLSGVAQLQRQASRDFILLALFTGARRANLSSMRWDEIDVDRGVWTIPKAKHKGKRDQTIPLVPPAREILARRLSERVNGSPWVFPGPGKLGHVTEPKAAMQKVRELSGLADLRFHDLRRTLGAWQNRSGVSLRVIQATLGHANIRTTAAAYTPTDDAPVRAAMWQVVTALLTAGEPVGEQRP
jgi:integrase